MGGDAAAVPRGEPEHGVIEMEDDYAYSEVSLESEVGATAGQTHLRVLEGVIGHERALASMTASGPPHAKKTVTKEPPETGTRPS